MIDRNHHLVSINHVNPLDIQEIEHIQVDMNAIGDSDQTGYALANFHHHRNLFTFTAAAVEQRAEALAGATGLLGGWGVDLGEFIAPVVGPAGVDDGAA